MSTPLHQRPYTPPPGSVNVLLIRHGASAPVHPGVEHPRFDGHGDPELDPVGIEQAERTAAALVAPGMRPIDAIYTSTLRRTIQTAEPLARRTGLTPTPLHDLREVYLGPLEAGGLRRLVVEDPAAFRRIMDSNRWDTIPGAESEEAFSSRVQAGLSEALRGRTDQTVALVVHGGVIARILADITGSSAFAFKGAENASVSEFSQWADGSRLLRSYNVISGDRARS